MTKKISSGDRLYKAFIYVVLATLAIVIIVQIFRLKCCLSR